MAKKVKMELDAAPLSAVATGGTVQWRRNRKKPRATVPTKAPRGTLPATPKFDGTCDGLKGCGGDVRWMLEREKLNTLVPPASLETSTTDVDKEIFKVEVSRYMKRRNRQRANLESAFTLILGQCTDLTCMQLEGLPNWDAVDDGSDVIKLLKTVKSLSHQTTNQKYHPLFLYMAKKSVRGLHQGPLMTNSQLVDNLKARVEAVEEIGVAVGVDAKLVEDELSTYLKGIAVIPTNAEASHIIKARRQSQERYLTVILLCVEDHSQSGGRLLQKLKNDSLKGHPTFTATLAKSLSMINDYSALSPTSCLTDGYEGATFSQKKGRSRIHSKKREIGARRRSSCPARQRRQGQVKEWNNLSPLPEERALLLRMQAPYPNPER